MDRERRAKWLFKPRTDVLEDIDVALLDVDDEDDRRLLIASEHPKLWRAITDGVDEVDVGGQTVNPEMHLAVHLVVANRILDDHPPAFWETAQRLTRHGSRRHDVLHMLATVVSNELHHTMTTGEHLSDADVRAQLWRLPGDNAPKRGTRQPDRRHRR